MAAMGRAEWKYSVKAALYPMRHQVDEFYHSQEFTVFKIQFDFITKKKYNHRKFF